MYYKLPDHEIVFPHPSLADEDGLLAIGGDLSMERLLLAYSNGIFPWYNDEDPILWYAPPQRCVIFPAELKISKSLNKVIHQNQFKITVNQNFQAVVANCASVKRADQEGTWINTDMQQAYLNLHQHGFAHSIEIWQQNELVGGLYGVQIKDVFCGESMFSLVSNASKMALAYLCKQGNFRLIDCQVPNDHLLSMGARLIDLEEYLDYLK
jgi:leucyl/phenylalanyl-tRNA--protein transferase